MVELTPGFYKAEDLSNEEYHAANGLSSSGVRKLLKSPYEYYAWYLAENRPKSEPTPAMALGTALHAAMLEPDVFAEQYVVCPHADKRRKEYKEWAAKESEGKNRLVVSAKENEDIKAMRESMGTHPIAASLLSKATDFELSAACEWEGVLLKARYDIVTSTAWLVDLKTCQDSSEDAARASIEKYGYYIQDAFYRKVMELTTGEPVAGFAFVFVESSYPFQVGVYTLDAEHEQLGWKLCEKAIGRYKRSMETGEWPSYRTQARELSLSEWRIRKIEEELLYD